MTLAERLTAIKTKYPSIAIAVNTDGYTDAQINLAITEALALIPNGCFLLEQIVYPLAYHLLKTQKEQEKTGDKGKAIQYQRVLTSHINTTFFTDKEFHAFFDTSGYGSFAWSKLKLCAKSRLGLIR